MITRKRNFPLLAEMRCLKHTFLIMPFAASSKLGKGVYRSREAEFASLLLILGKIRA